MPRPSDYSKVSVFIKKKDLIYSYRGSLEVHTMHFLSFTLNTCKDQVFIMIIIVLFTYFKI